MTGLSPAVLVLSFFGVALVGVLLHHVFGMVSVLLCSLVLSAGAAASWWAYRVSRSLSRQGRFFASLASAVSDAVLVISAGKVSFCSPSLRRLEVTLGAPVLELVHPEDRSLLERLEDGAAFDLRLSSGESLRIFSFSVRDLSGDGVVDGFVLSGRDVTHERALAARLEHRLRHHHLSGLPNRLALSEFLDSSGEVSLVVLDLASFSRVNDALGFPLGDRVLCAVGERLSASLGEGMFLSHLGGDVFAIAVPGPSSRALFHASSLEELFSVPVSVGGVSLMVSCRIGVASAPADGDSFDPLMRAAEAALRSARAPFEVVVASPGLADGSSSDLSLLGELSAVLADPSSSELVLHYQPKFDSSGRIDSLEALVRWEHPVRGLLSPGMFVPLLEETALVHPFTDRVLDLALSQLEVWSREGCAVPVAVNLSARNLDDPRLLERISERLLSSGVSPELVEFELTETAVLSDPGRAVAFLSGLRLLGCTISLDDFGAGHTSLSQLSELPVDVVKLDRSLVGRRCASSRRAFVVASLVDLSHRIGMRVVAEGVEDLDTLVFLYESGVDLVQGFLLSRPLPPGELSLPPVSPAPSVSIPAPRVSPEVNASGEVPGTLEVPAPCILEV